MTFQEIRIIATGPCIANQLRDVNIICRRSWYIAAHIWKIYDFKIEVVNLFESIIIETHVNSNSHVSTLCIINLYFTNKSLTGVTSGAGTAYPSRAPEFTPGFQWGLCYSSFTFICVFCRSLFYYYIIIIIDFDNDILISNN
jgi:hypothetical protein